MIGILNNIIQKIPVHHPSQGYYLRWYFNGWHYWLFLPGTITMTTQGEKYRTLGNKNVSVSSGQITREQARAIRTILHTKEISILTDTGWKSVKIDDSTVIIYDSGVAGVQIDFVINIGSRIISNTGYTRIPIIIPHIPIWVTDTVCINGQLWAQNNYNALYPGSKVYDDDENNRAIYGGLYTYNQIVSDGFCPAGYHVPSLTECEELINFLSTNQGNKLKEAGTTHWNTTGGTDDYSFKAIGAGYHVLGFNYLGLKDVTYFLTSTEHDVNTVELVRISHNEAEVQINNIYSIGSKLNYFSVRFIADAPCNPNLGYGFLYNWYAVIYKNIAPAGWHVLTQAEFYTLVNPLGGIWIAGGKLKESGYIYWKIPNTDADNSSGFTGRGSGVRGNDAEGGVFSGFNETCRIWFIPDAPNVYGQFLLNNSSASSLPGYSTDTRNQKWGCSIRCIADSTTKSEGQTGTVTDIDGNVYPTKVIAGMEVMTENLRVTRYNDGTPIPNVTDNTEWANLTTAGRCTYNNEW